MTKLSEIVQRIVRTRLSGYRYQMSKISNRISEPRSLSNSLIDYNASYNYVKYGKGRYHYSILINATLTSIVEYMIDNGFCDPLSEQYEVLESIYNQSANSLSQQIKFKYN